MCFHCTPWFDIHGTHWKHVVMWISFKWHVYSKTVSNKGPDDIMTLYAVLRFIIGYGNVIYETVYIGSNVSW